MVAYLFAVIYCLFFCAYIPNKPTGKTYFKMGLKLMLLFFNSDCFFLIFMDTRSLVCSLMIIYWILPSVNSIVHQFFMVSFTYVYGTFYWLLIGWNNSILCMASLLGINFLTNLLMIPQFQAIGAAWTTVITLTFCLEVAEIFLTSKVIGSLFSGKKNGLNFAPLSSSALTFFFHFTFYVLVNWLGMISSKIICLLLFFILKLYHWVVK